MRKAAVLETGPVDGPWDLPSGWRWENLANVGQWGSGGTPKAKTPSFYGGGIPWFKIGDLRDGWTKPPEQTITELGLSQSSAKIVPENALLVAMYGSIGKLGLTSFPCATNQAIAFCIPRLEKVTLKWLFYFLLGRRSHLLSLGKGGTQQNISQTVLLQEPVPIPPLETQRRIVARIDGLFSELDDGEAALARARADLETYRKSLLKAAVTGELTADWRAANPPAETGEQLLQRILAERKGRWEADLKNKGRRYKEPVKAGNLAYCLPPSWGIISIEQACAAGRPIGYGVLQPGPHIEDGVQLVRVGDINHGEVARDLKRIDPKIADSYPRTLLQGGEVLLTIVGTIGRTAVVPMSLRGANVARAVAVLPVSEGISPDWIHLALSYVGNQERLVGSAHEVARKTLNLEDVRPFPLPLPPLPEQEAIVGRVSELLHSVADAIAVDAFSSDSIRQSILAAAFRGELVQ